MIAPPLIPKQLYQITGQRVFHEIKQNWKLQSFIRKPFVQCLPSVSCISKYSYLQPLYEEKLNKNHFTQVI